MSDSAFDFIRIGDAPVVVCSGNPPGVVFEMAERGPPGPPGSSAASYVHTQTIASNEWVIAHNLGFRPAVTLLTVGGAEFDASIVHESINLARAQLTANLAGVARCN